VLRELTVADVSMHHAAATCVAGAATTDGSAAAARDKAKIQRYRTPDPHACVFTILSVENLHGQNRVSACWASL
jgi:hypothetical protein